MSHHVATGVHPPVYQLSGQEGKCRRPKQRKDQRAGQLPTDKAGDTITRLPYEKLLVFGGM